MTPEQIKKILENIDGVITHKDGNVFFRGEKELQAFATALLASEQGHDAKVIAEFKSRCELVSIENNLREGKCEKIYQFRVVAPLPNDGKVEWLVNKK